MLTADRLFAELEHQTALLADAVHGLDPSRPVPTCPQWTVAELVEHVGLGHRWASVIVERRATGPVPNEEADDREVPPGADGRSVWLLAGARRLCAAVGQAGPRAAVWTWADDRTAGFWLRRITHDTLIHRVDAELTAGRPVTIAAELAADGVSDLLMMFSVLPKIDDFPALATLRGHGETLHFHATDDGLGAAGEWLVRRGQDGVAWEHGHGRGDVAVRGRAADLLLVLSRRAAPDPERVAVLGDRAIFTQWLEHSRF